MQDGFDASRLRAGRSGGEDTEGSGAARQEGEARFWALFENMSEGIAYCRMLFEGDRPANFVYLAVNGAFERLTGLRDVIGKRVTEVIPGIAESDPSLFEIYGEVARTGTPKRFEMDVHALRMWFSISVYRPEPDHFVAVFDVITDRKRAELEREMSVAFLRLVNESRSQEELIRRATTFFQEESGCDAVGIRLQEGDDFPYFEARGFPAAFVRAESSLCAIGPSGALARDANGHAVLECMCGNVISGRFDPLKPFFTANGSYWTNNTTELLATITEADRQARTRNRCNTEGYESVALLPLRVGEERLGLLQLNDRRIGRFSPEGIALWERLAGYLAVALGKSEAEDRLRRANEELERRVAERTARFEAANRELEAFAYSVSHDLRAPLRAIDGFLGILLRDHAGTFDAEGRRLGALVVANARRMAQLIDGLLALSRLGRTAMQVSKVEMEPLVRAVFEEVVPEPARSRVDFRLGPLPAAAGDPTLLRQVWSNLLSNAVKYSSKRELAVIEVSGRREGSEAVYSVRDNGVGFDMAHAGKLFGVFERLHSLQDFEGTGIGLALVQRIVERHGGRAWAEGAPDQGATFSFALP